MLRIKSGVVKLRFSPDGGAVVTELFAGRFEFGYVVKDDIFHLLFNHP